jgi:3-hydroxyacyl-[acyl-carrier-protein] dehydratase
MSDHSSYPRSFGKELICDLIPHRPPLLLVDTVEEWGEGFLIATKKILETEEVFKGHFPTKSVYPGVYLLEGLAQSAALLMCLLKQYTWHDTIYYLASLKDVKFRKSAYPGETLFYNINFKKSHGRFVQVIATATTGDKEVCSAIITSAQGN